MKRFIPSVIALVIVFAICGGLYACTDSDCQSRGGHTEIVYGGRGGWVCDGAIR